MAHKRKRGPKTPWQNRARYNRAKCQDRLKPCQIHNLAAADAFASFTGKRLNCFLTIKLSEITPPLAAFRQGVKRLSQWHRQWGGEFTWLYVWEAVGGFHVHALVFVPNGTKQDFQIALIRAFSEHNVLLQPRLAGQSAMAYLCKGTDFQTHRALKGNSCLNAKKQGRIAWARCGVTENLGKSVRAQAGFDLKNPARNCVKTYRRQLDDGKHKRAMAGKPKQLSCDAPSLVVLETTNSPAKVTGGAAHLTQAPDGTGNRFDGSRTRAIGTGFEELREPEFLGALKIRHASCQKNPHRNYAGPNTRAQDMDTDIGQPALIKTCHSAQPRARLNVLVCNGLGAPKRG